MRSATSTSSATLAARTGCSLVGTMKRGDRQHPGAPAARPGSRSGPRPASAPSARCISRSKPSATTACSSRLARPRLSASGRRPCACGCTTASVRTPLARSQRASAGSCAGSRRPERAFAVVVEARRLEQDQRDVGRDRRPLRDLPGRHEQRARRRAGRRGWARAPARACGRSDAGPPGGAPAPGPARRWRRRSGACPRPRPWTGSRGSRPAGLEEGRPTCIIYATFAHFITGDPACSNAGY